MKRKIRPSWKIIVGEEGVEVDSESAKNYVPIGIYAVADKDKNVYLKKWVAENGKELKKTVEKYLSDGFAVWIWWEKENKTVKSAE